MCDRVIDGDSLVVLRDGQSLEIRLEGIDCPEFDQPYRKEAKSFTAALYENKQLRIQTVGRDKYGRRLVRAFVDDREVNAELVKAGLAWQYGRDGRLSWLEKQAKARQVGIWSQPNPIPPWEWRSKNQ
jgi:endonuclease YncB( thermonuclease family)